MTMTHKGTPMTSRSSLTALVPAFTRVLTLVSGLCLLLSGPAPAQTPVAAQTPAPAIVLDIPAATASRQISVKVTPGLTHTKKLPNAALRTARQTMLDGRDISPDDLRALADHNDGLAALKYTRLLVASGSATASDIAYYGSIAVSTGRVWVLRDAVDAMRRLDPATEPAARKKAYLAMLYPHAWAGNGLALDTVIDLNGEGRLFGPMSDATRQRILEQGDANGDGRAALRLALMLLQTPTGTADDDALLRDYLGRAMAGNNLEVQTIAANLLTLRTASAAADTGEALP